MIMHDTGTSRIVPLRGRDAELAALTEQLATLASGTGGAVLIQGVPGIGKSRLLAEAHRRAEAAGLRVLNGSGDPEARIIPFGSLLDLFLSTAGSALPAFTTDDNAPTASRGYWLLQDIQEHLERAALSAPLVIVLDDLQWCDESTLLALRTLPARLSSYPILWLLAARTGPSSPAARATVAALNDHLLVLAPLSGDAVAAMSRDLLGSAPDADLLRLVSKAEGRPLLLAELLEGLRDEGRIEIADDVARLTGTGLPRRFHSSIRHRLDQVSPLARQIADVAAALGRVISVDQVAELVAQPPAALLKPLDELLSADLLAETDGRLTFRHDLVREAVQATLSPSLRLALRRQAVQQRLRHGASVVQVAAELAETAEPGDQHAVSMLRQASRELAATSPSAAAAMSRRAIELASADPLQQAAIIAESLPRFSQAGLAAEAAALADTALRQRLPAEIEAQVSLGLALAANQHSFPDAARAARAGAALPGLPEQVRAQLLAMLAFNLILIDADEAEEAERLLPEALRVAERAGDAPATATLLTVASLLAYYRFDVPQALDLAERAAHAVDDVPHSAALWTPGIWQSVLLSMIGCVDDALAEAAAGVRSAQHSGQAALLRMWGMVRCRIYLDTGRLADARAEAEAVLAMADELGPGNFDDVTARYVLGRVALHTGDETGLTQAREVAGVMMGAEAGEIRRAGAWLAAQAAAATGDHAGMAALTAKAEQTYFRPTPVLPFPPDPADEPALVRMVLQAGLVERAARAAEFAEIRYRRNPDIPVFGAAAAHARGLLDGDPGLLGEAARRYAEASRPLARAAALEDAGAALRERSSLDEALALYEEAGAARDAERVVALLKSMGARRLRPSAGRPASGWDSLTASELQVVRLVAGGITNRQVADRLFLSPHTVSTHLRHAFTKLGINSRVALTRLVLTRDQDGDDED
ncbi:helix-turn-helix transcriptional regulator [Micromonospora sp. CB01531]|uniref:helix-turn-helix transcriptional regulator n=1 Tax=Micromonospora sp. CB01531 TaxID=1718947 RepID=UPI00093CAE01|nr:LuxR family transcriptional regulator [Micromonospora sp. CB01531]